MYIEGMDQDKPDFSQFVIDQFDLDRLSRMAKRLFKEDRLDGNVQRDFAQTLESIIRRCSEVPVP